MFSRHSPRSPRFLTGLLAVLVVAGFCGSLLMGRLPISPADIAALVSRGIAGAELPETLVAKGQIFWLIRVPRCIMALIVGMGLSVSGAVYQALFRNPIVSPDILGVSAGCTVGAALGLILPVDFFPFVQILSFSFGLLAVLLSVTIARLISIKPVIVLVLAGLVVLSFFNAWLMVLKYFSDPYEQLPSIVFWIMGSLTRITWTDLLIALPVTAAGLGLFMLLRYRLNIISLGDVQARSLGMNPARFRMVLVATSSLVVAMIVATCGQIGWIGLIIPHMARTLVGPEHERMLPITALLGGLFMLLADGVARSVSSAEIPVGIITALTGAPIFGYLLYKNRGSGWL